MEFNTVVRAFGSDVTHVVLVEENERQALESFKVPFTGFPTPMSTECGRRLRGVQSSVVMMEIGTRVKCGQCRALTGLETQTVDSYRPLHRVAD